MADDSRTNMGPCRHPDFAPTLLVPSLRTTSHLTCTNIGFPVRYATCQSPRYYADRNRARRSVRNLREPRPGSYFPAASSLRNVKAEANKGNVQAGFKRDGWKAPWAIEVAHVRPPTFHMHQKADLPAPEHTSRMRRR